MNLKGNGITAPKAGSFTTAEKLLIITLLDRCPAALGHCHQHVAIYLQDSCNCSCELENLRFICVIWSGLEDSQGNRFSVHSLCM